MSAATDNTPFFILGAARSGTTMLRLMLNSHSRLAIPFESHFLVRIFRELPLDCKLGTEQANQVADIVIAEKNFQTWHLDPELVRNNLLNQVPASLSVLVDTLYKMEIAESGKPRWGDKTPYYYECWYQLSELFPQAKLVHIIRDGRDVVRSLEKVDWHGPTNEDRARYWQERVEIAHIAARELGPERNLIVRYEDLVLDAQSILNEICEFLGESFEPGMLNFYQDANRHISGIDGDVHAKLDRPPRSDDIERWRFEMSEWDQIRFEAIAGAGLRMMMYPCRFS